MELADVLDSKSSALGRAGSSPATGTNKKRQLRLSFFIGELSVPLRETLSLLRK